MTDKTATYAGTHIIQPEMPTSNYVGSEQDNVVFQSNPNEEISVEGTFTNTHQPIESDNVNWNRVEVNWNNQAIGYNLLDESTSKCGDDGTIGSWGAGGTNKGTLSVSTTTYYSGKSSIRVDTPGLLINEGMGTPYVQVTPNQRYSTKIVVTGSGYITIQLLERDVNGTLIGSGTVKNVKLSKGKWTTVDLTRDFTTGVQANVKIMTQTNIQKTTFYIDSAQINPGDPGDWVQGTNGCYAIYNQLSASQANCGGSGDTRNFLGIKFTETISVDSTNYYYNGDGTKTSIKIATPGTVGNEGVTLIPYLQVNVGQTISAKIAVKGTGTVYIAINEFSDDGTWILNHYWVGVPGKSTTSSTNRTNVTLSSTWQVFDITAVILSGNQASISVGTTSAQAVTFNIDMCQLNFGTPAPWMPGGIPTDFSTKMELYGIMHDGEAELIREYNTQALVTGTNPQAVSFDLKSGSGEPPVTRDLGKTNSGQIKLRVPKSIDQYDAITINRVWYDANWSSRKALYNSVGGAIPGLTNVHMYLTITYDPAMQPDFSDLVFTDEDGFTPLNFYVINVTNSTSAIVLVQLPQNPAPSQTKNIYLYFGNPNTINHSDGFSTFDVFDDFNDSSIDYSLWTTDLPVGSVSESGGSFNITVPATSNGDWGASVKAAPVASVPLPTTVGAGWSFIVKMNFTIIDDCNPGLALWLDRNNVYLFGRHRNDGSSVNNLAVSKIVGGTYTSQVGSVAVTATSLWLRVFFNGTTWQFQYSTDSANWNTVYSVSNSSLGFTPTKLGMHCRKWNTTTALTVSFDYAFIRFNPSLTYGSYSSTQVPKTNISGYYLTEPSTCQEIIYYLPTNYSPNDPMYFNVTELSADVYESPDVPVDSSQVFRLGSDHVSKYHALRVVITTNSDLTNLITFNYVKYSYSL